MIRATAGIIKKDNKILIAERPVGKPYSGYWEFPGGKIEQNETGEAALIRELYEELGIHITSARFWFEHTHTYPDKTILLELWLVENFSGELRSQENQTLRWATFPELLIVPWLEGNWAIVEKLRELVVC